MKTCNFCSIEQEDDQFRTKGGRQCRLCRNKKHLEYGEKYRESAKGKIARLREYERGRAKGWNIEYLQRGRDKKLKKYGLTQDDYRQMLAKQKGACAICGNPETALKVSSEGTLHLAVDHNHTTGEVRELLCRKCNLGISVFEENVEYIANAISYIEKHKAKAEMLMEA